MNLKRDRDPWEWKERVLSNAVRQAGLECERNAVLLQRQHETKLTLMLRHLAEETSASSSYNDQRFMRAVPSNTQMMATTTTSTSPQYSDSDNGFDFYKNACPVGGAVKLLKSKHGEIEICPLLPDALTKYKPLDKLKEKDRETKNKLFAKFQVLTRYGGQSVSMAHAAGNEDEAAVCLGSNAKKKEKLSSSGHTAALDIRGSLNKSDQGAK